MEPSRTARDLIKRYGGTTTSIVGSLVLGFMSALVLGGCAKVESFNSLLKETPAPIPTGWQSPLPLDLGTFGENYLQLSSVAYPSPLPSVTPSALPSVTVSQSFSTHRMVRSGDRAAWVGSISEGSGFSVYGRIYSARKLLTSSSPFVGGWAGVGNGFGRIDSGLPSAYTGAGGYDQIAVGAAYDGSILSAFSSLDAGILSFQSSVFGPGMSWGYFGAAYATPTSPKPQAAFPWNLAYEPSRGRASDLAWDRSGNGYFGWVSSEGLHEAYLRRYQAFAGWDPAVPQVLGRQAVQIQMLDDGVGVTALWRTEFSSSVSLGAGTNHTCSVNNGVIRCWGKQSTSALGRTSSCTAPGTLPSVVAAPKPDDVDCLDNYTALSVAAGDNHTCAILKDSTGANSVWCWGDNTAGQLGQGTTTGSSVAPVQVSGWAAGYSPASLAAAANSTCVVLSHATSNHEVYCWGQGSGTLGTTSSTATPTQLGIPVTERDQISLGQISMGSSSGGVTACVISGKMSSGGATRASLASVICWGANGWGQAGTTATAFTDPVNLEPGIGAGAFTFSVNKRSALEIAVGGAFACMLTRSSLSTPVERVYCWGRNNYGQLGDGLASGTSPASSATAVLAIVPVGSKGIAASREGACAIATDNRVLCWGNPDIATGGTTGFDNIPGYVSGAVSITSITAGANHYCAMDSSRQVSCWGYNNSGQLGDQVGVGVGSSSPIPVSQPFDCASGKCLFAAWSLDSGFTKRVLLAENVRSFSAESDSEGNVLAVMTRDSSVVSSSSCSQYAPNCHVRVFSAQRNALGQWLTPSQLDAALTATLTTMYQPSLSSGGTDFPTPALAFLGSGSFLAAYPMIDATNLGARVSSVQVRKYIVGAGWQAGTTVLDSSTLIGFQSNVYRAANEVRLLSDGAGRALLALHGVIPTSNDYLASGRSYGYRFYRYALGEWSDSTSPTISTSLGVPVCPATNPACHVPQIEGAVFSSGEAVVVFGAPDPTNGARFRLYSTEYR